MGVIPSEMGEIYGNTSFQGNSCNPSNLAENDPAFPSKTAVEELGKAMEVPSSCERETATITSEEVDNYKFGGVAVGMMGVGVMGGAGDSTTTSLEDRLSEKGCGTFLGNASRILTSQKAIACTLNKSLTGQTMTLKAGTSILIETIGMTAAQQEIQRLTIERMTTEAADANTEALNTMIGAVAIGRMTDAQVDNGFSSIERIAAGYEKNMQRYMELNPSRSSVVGSDLTIRVDKDIEVKMGQENLSDMKANIMAEIEKVAVAQAEQDLSQEFGTRANTPEIKQMITSEVQTDVGTESTNIMEKITNSKLDVSDETNIVLRFQGSLKNTTIVVDTLIQIRAQMEQAVSSGMQIGHSVATKLKARAMTSQSTETTSKGLDDLKTAQLEGVAEIIEEINEGHSNFFGSLFGAFSGIGLLFLMPMIAAVAILMFFPNLIKGFLPPPVRYVLIGVLIFLIVAFIFGIFPFRSSENMKYTRDPKFAEKVHQYLSDLTPKMEPQMQMQPPRSDNRVSYNVTNTRGYNKDKRPYKNFKVGGNWKM